MTPVRSLLFALTLAIPPGSHAQQHQRDREIHDADTLEWWHTTEALSNDGMEGRDTGSAAYQRAAQYVASRFKAAGLEPAGESGSYLQSVPMHESSVTADGTSFSLIDRNGSETALTFLQQISIAPADDLAPKFEAPLTFRGYCGKDVMADIAGKIVVCFGTQREGLPSGAARAANARDGSALGLINVDDPYFTIEPPRWPYAYARTVTLRSPTAVSTRPVPLAVMRLSAQSFAALLSGTGQDADAILKLGGAKQPLPNFEIPRNIRVKLHLAQRDIASPNILAKLRGTDSRLNAEYVVIAAHLDGYGFGTPVNGDNLYNGTLDDAAYVALLIQMGDDIKAHRLRHPKRSILFAAFTGEEKGLLGSHWFADHPTVPADALAADVNLDQLRPLFPLNILTAEAPTRQHRSGKRRASSPSPCTSRFALTPNPSATCCAAPINIRFSRSTFRQSASSSATTQTPMPRGATVSGIRSAITVRRTISLSPWTSQPRRNSTPSFIVSSKRLPMLLSVRPSIPRVHSPRTNTRSQALAAFPQGSPMPLLPRIDSRAMTFLGAYLAIWAAATAYLGIKGADWIFPAISLAVFGAALPALSIALTRKAAPPPVVVRRPTLELWVLAWFPGGLCGSFSRMGNERDTRLRISRPRAGFPDADREAGGTRGRAGRIVGGAWGKARSSV